MDKQLDRLMNSALKFRNKRDWIQFHTGKDLAMCLSVEANELLELFLWKDEKEVNLKKLKDEMGDVFYSLLLLAEKYSIDLEKTLMEKLKQNEKKYPIDRFHGSNKKYDE